MDHSSHSSNDHHDHMNHGSMGEAIGSKIVSNLTDIIAHSMDHASDSIPNLSADASMDNMHGHHNHMDMTGTTMDMGGMGGMGGMKMYFHVGYDEYVLFKGWHIDGVWGLIGSVIAIIALVIFYEGLKFGREVLFKRSISSMQTYCQAAKNNQAAQGNVPLQYMDHMLITTTLSIWSSGHFIQTFLHMLQFLISYCIMLIFMTYNVWLCLACLIGSGIGYFLFGWKKAVVVDVTEHCH